jgi:phosphonate transport system permease protein
MQHYAAKRPWRHFLGLVAIFVLVAGSFWAAEWDFSAFTDSEKRSIALERMGLWISAFTSPDFSSEALELGWVLTKQTLSAALLGSGLAVVFAYVLAMGSARSVMVGDERGRGWRGRLRGDTPFAYAMAVLSLIEDTVRHLFCAACRLIQDVLRAVPDFVWAILMVAVVGLGPLTGALALALNMTGILAKVYSELWDSVDEREYEQVRSMGSGRLKTFFYGIRPLAARSVQSFTLMRAECAIRNAAVIGVVGGGGLGADIWYQIGLGQWNRASTLILFTLALTLSADIASNFIRRQLRSDPNHPRAIRGSSTAAKLARAYVGVGFAMLMVVWAVWFMGWGDNAPPGQEAKNFLEPALKMAKGESWEKLTFFEDLLDPDWDKTALGIPSGDTERELKRNEAKIERLRAADKIVDMNHEYGWGEFYKWAAWVSWEKEAQKWFVWRVIKSSAVPLSMAIVGTLLGVLLAIMLTYPHSLAFQLEPSKFTGERPHPLVRVQRFLQLTVARMTGLTARGVPEIMWAFLFIAFVGPGLLAGTMAITVHTVGVLVRVFGETVDNIPYRRFEQSFMGSRMACFGYVASPISWKDWMTYSFFQFESNVRTSVVLGIVGVGGLGFMFSANFEFFQFERASTCLIMIVLLTIVIDRISRALKLSRVSR